MKSYKQQVFTLNINEVKQAIAEFCSAPELNCEIDLNIDYVEGTNAIPLVTGAKVTFQISE